MTAYRGSVTFRLSGLRDGTGAFTASSYTTVELTDSSLAPDSMFSATFSASGLPWALFDGNGSVPSSGDPVSFASTPFSTTLAAAAMPFDSAASGLGIVWINTSNFIGDRSQIFIGGGGTFSGVVNGAAASGTISAIGFLSATTSAYHIVPDAAVGPEGDSGITAYTFTVTRRGATTTAGDVAWQVVGSGPNPASASDFAGLALPSGTLSFAPFEEQKTLTVEVLGDAVVEPDEGFAVLLANVPGEVIDATPVAQGVIGTDDIARIGIAPLLADVAEGGAGATTPLTFTVTRFGNTSLAVSAGWSVRGIGATPADAADFVGGSLPSGTVSFLAGEISQTITVPVAGDLVPEVQESFLVELSNPIGGAGLSDSTAPGLILNDDGGIDQVADSTAADETFDMGDGNDLVRFTAVRSSYQIGVLENRILVQGPDGTDVLTDVEWLKFGNEIAITREALRGQSQTESLMRFLNTGGGNTQPQFVLPMRYSGPLDLAYVYPGTDNDDVVGGTFSNDFMNLGAGNDAADMGGGNDIIDGGGGSNFLTGGVGVDAFFLDGRFAVPVWSCITDWEQGEKVSLWGWQPGVSTGAWGENAGLPGYLGATFFADIDGNGAVETAVTLAGHIRADVYSAGEVDMGGGVWLYQFN